MSNSKQRLITNPGWYARGIGKDGKITDLNLADSMDNYCRRVRAAMTLMISIDEEVVPSEGIEGVAWIVSDMTDEAKALLDQWWKDKGNEKADVAAIK